MSTEALETFHALTKSLAGEYSALQAAQKTLTAAETPPAQQERLDVAYVAAVVMSDISNNLLFASTNTLTKFKQEIATTAKLEGVRSNEEQQDKVVATVLQHYNTVTSSKSTSCMLINFIASANS